MTESEILRFLFNDQQLEGIAEKAMTLEMSDCDYVRLATTEFVRESLESREA